MTVLRKFLLTYTEKSNIFKNKNYDIGIAESYGIYHEIHKIDKIKVIFKDGIASIKFLEGDSITAFYLYSLIVNNDFAYDDKITASLNSISISRGTSELEDFINISKLNPHLRKKNVIQIFFSDMSSFKYNSQNVFFLITPYHHDLYYYDLEIERLNNKIGTDDEI